jgi:integrase
VARSKRANGAGQIYTKHGNYYGRWVTAAGGRTNRRLGAVRRPGTAVGLTRTQAEKRLRELMAEIQAVTDPDVTLEVAGAALLAQLEAKGCSKSHLETVESHLRVHLAPFFKAKPVDRISDVDVTRLLVDLRRRGRAPKTIRNILSTLHSLFELSLKRRWASSNPCKLVDLPAVPPSGNVRYLTQPELLAVLDEGVPDDGWRQVERPLYLMAAMTGLRQGELLGLRWLDLDRVALKVRVRQAFVRGEFKAPKSVRGIRGVPLAMELAEALDRLRDVSSFTADDDLVFAHPETGGPLDRSRVRKRFQAACRRAGVRVVRFHDLRHTFGTRIAASGEVSLRTLQEWMGHRDPKTTMIYADYQPGEREAEIVGRAFRPTPDGFPSSAA